MSAARFTGTTGLGRRGIQVGGLWFDALARDQVVEVVRSPWAAGQGGSIVPVNVDVALAVARDPQLADLTDSAKSKPCSRAAHTSMPASGLRQSQLSAACGQ